MGKYKDKDLVGVILANTVHSVYWMYEIGARDRQLRYQAKAVVEYDRGVVPGYRDMRVRLFTDPGRDTAVEVGKLGREDLYVPDLVLKT